MVFEIESKSRLGTFDLLSVSSKPFCTSLFSPCDNIEVDGESHNFKFFD